MATFAVFEIWTRCHTVEAASEDEAYDTGLKEAYKNADGQLNFSNWHLIQIDESARRVLEGPAGQGQDASQWPDGPISMAGPVPEGWPGGPLMDDTAGKSRHREP